MDFRILGPLDVRDDDRPVALGGTRQRALLALLLLHANEVVSSDRLVDELWGESALGEGSKALQVAVSRLRKAIGSGALLTRKPGYELRVRPGELDLDRFEQLAAEGRAALAAGNPAAASAKLSDALALWRGPPLDDVGFEASLQTEIARLEELRLGAHEDRIEAELALGRYREAIGELERLTARHPHRERLRGQLMLALYRSGRQAEALELYRETRRTLVDELGIEPGPALQELERAILAHDPKLEPALAEAAPTPSILGRERELEQFGRVLRRAIAGSGGVILVAGEPGIGKSRLAEALAAQAAEHGARVLVGRSWEAGGAPAFWPWIQAVRACVRDTDPETVRSWLGRGGPDLAAMLPDLREVLPDLPEADAPSSSGARFRLFEAFAGFLGKAASTRPLAIVLDDLHAADAPSVLLLRFVADALADAPILIVACYRDTEVGLELAEALPDLARSASVHRIALAGLSQSDTARLLELITGEAPGDELAAKVHEETDGNPLYAGEVGRLLAAEGIAGDAARLPVPRGVREAIRRRLQALSDPCRQALTLASVLGREFELDALERVGDLDQVGLDAAVEEAIAAGLVGEVPDAGGRLRFSHILIRDAVYEELPATRRLRLHLAIGEALEALYAGNPVPHFAELARHYLLSGGSGAGKAVRYSQAAGDRAVSQLAFEEAARHYRSALEVLEARGAAAEEQACDLLLSLGDALHRAGRGAEAKEALRRAAEIAERNGWAERLAHAALGFSGRFTWARASTDPALVPLLERALKAVGDVDSQVRVRLLARLAGARRDEPLREPRVELAQEAVEIAERMGDPATLARALEGYWVAVESPDDRLLHVGPRLIPLAERIGERELVFAAHDHQLNAVWSVADRAAVDVEVTTLEALAEELRQPAQWWNVGTVRTMLALMEGRFDEAKRLIAETRAIGDQSESWNARVSERLGLFVLRRAQGRLAELEDTMSRSVHEYPALLRFRCALVHLYGELGREPEARAALDGILKHDLTREYLDAEWLFSLTALAEPTARVGADDAVATVYGWLQPYASRYAQAPVEATFGSVARALGVLATRLSRLDEAEHHFETALEIEQRMRARPWLAHAQHDYGCMLRERDGPGDQQRARDLTTDAVRTYRQLGMDTWAERTDRPTVA